MSDVREFELAQPERPLLKSLTEHAGFPVLVRMMDAAYNSVRPHSSLGYLSPEEYAATIAARPASPPTLGRLPHACVGANGCPANPGR